MAVKVNVAFSKKLGLPNYGSLGAACSIEAEVDGSLLNDTFDGFQQHVQRLYGACAQAVQEELQRQRDIERAATTTGRRPAPSNGRKHNAPRQATHLQVRAIDRIVSREGIDLVGLLHERFGVDEAGELSIHQASDIIEELKSLQAARQ